MAERARRQGRTPGPGARRARRRRVRVAVVIKRSAWDLAKDEPEDRLHALLERGDPTVANVMAGHAEHAETVAEVKRALESSGALVTRVGRWKDGLDADDFDLVVTVGGDGTLLHAAQNVGATPVLAVNSSPSTSVGFFCGARKGRVLAALEQAVAGKLKRAYLTRMRVIVNGELVSSRVLNDALFCHRSPAATSRYILELGDIHEEQKSSGFWVGPAAGSTAGQRSAGGDVLPLTSRSLQLIVREPYRPKGVPYRLSTVRVSPGDRLRVRSKSRQMRMYLDGPDNIVQIGLGDVVEFTHSPEPLCLLGISSRRKWR